MQPKSREKIPKEELKVNSLFKLLYFFINSALYNLNLIEPKYVGLNEKAIFKILFNQVLNTEMQNIVTIYDSFKQILEQENVRITQINLYQNPSLPKKPLLYVSRDHIQMESVYGIKGLLIEYSKDPANNIECTYLEGVELINFTLPAPESPSSKLNSSYERFVNLKFRKTPLK